MTDASTSVGLENVCVTLGPPIRCWTATNSLGQYFIDLRGLGPDGQMWDLYFLRTGFIQKKETVSVNGPTVLNVAMQRTAPAEPIPSATPVPGLVQPTPAPTFIPTPCADLRSGDPTNTVYLPNITKTLGGATGWQTPFIVQNTGTTSTDLEASFYRFSDGTCVTRLSRAALLPGTSQAYSPNSLSQLPHDTQFAVVVRSFGSTIVSVVNEHSGTGARAEALSYVGVSQGAQSVFLPNITRRFFGYVTPFIIQNLGTDVAQATAKFVPFETGIDQVTATRSIPVGGSKFIDPNSEPGLIDGKQYSVTVTANQPISVVVNTHNDAPTNDKPVAYSANGIAKGAPIAYGPYAAKNAAGIGRVSTIVVQNLGGQPITPSLQFDILGGGGATQLITSPAAVPAGASWAFDPRFTLNTTTPCSGASATCLGDGEFSFIARSNDPSVNIAVAVNVISDATAMGYTALANVTTKAYLPNITRRLGGDRGWTTPILLQTIGATSGATVRWYRFSDGSLVLTQTVTVAPGRGIRIDPREVAGLADDTQYAVVVDGTGGSIGAIVMELADGGDNAMIYEGFALAAPAP